MRAVVATAFLSLLLFAGPARAEVRTGTALAGTMSPSAPSTRIVGGLASYDSASGALRFAVRLAAPTGVDGAPATSVNAVAGIWRDGRCGESPGSPFAVVGGLPYTFRYPPPDPLLANLRPVKLASIGGQILSGDVVVAGLVGATVTLDATSPLFVAKDWSCAYYEVAADGDTQPVLDRTAAFPLAPPGAGAALAGRALRVRGGRVAFPLKNGGAATRGTITIAAGRTTIVRRAPYTVGTFASKRLSLPLTRAGRVLLARQPSVRVKVTVSASFARRATATATLKR